MRYSCLGSERKGRPHGVLPDSVPYPDHDVAIDGAGPQACEDTVDATVRRLMHGRADLALGGERDRLGEVGAAADDGAAQLDALQYDVEGRDQEAMRPARGRTASNGSRVSVDESQPASSSGTSAWRS